jgi:hypothetical protein
LPIRRFSAPCSALMTVCETSGEIWRRRSKSEVLSQ